MENRERFLVLRNALEKLPEKQRSAIILSKYQGFSNKDTAEIMNLSSSAIEALISRARKNLKDHLFKYFEKKHLIIRMFLTKMTSN